MQKWRLSYLSVLNSQESSALWNKSQWRKFHKEGINYDLLPTLLLYLHKKVIAENDHYLGKPGKAETTLLLMTIFRFVLRVLLNFVSYHDKRGGNK